MDLSQYLEVFIDEAKEHLQSLSDQLMVLEQEPENEDCINEIFRAAHSLKGMAGTMGYKNMQRLTHDMENAFQEVRSGNMKVTPELIDILFRGVDALDSYEKNIEASADEGPEDNAELIKALNDVIDKETGRKPVDNIAGETKEAEPQTPSADKSADDAKASGDPDLKAKYQDLTISDFEKNAIEKAQADNLNIIGVTVYLQESCVLKAARAFMVFQALEEQGEVIKSVPSAQDIEDEKFDLEFSLIVFSELTPEEVQKKIENISEINKVFVGPFKLPESAEKPSEDTPVDTKPEENTEEPKAAQKPKTGTAAKAKVNNKKDTKKVSIGKTVRVDIEKLDDLMNLVSELIIAKNGLVAMSDSQAGGNTAFNEQVEYLESVTTNLHESVMKVRMVPVESVFSRFPRMVRDLTKKLDKKMELIMSGEDTELDRTVIDEIGDPLQHLIRNAADHGLESNEERVNLGKSEVGHIYLNAYQDGNNVNIEVKDDGAGIDIATVRRKAIERGTITPEQAEVMTDKDFIDLLFLPSFSTSEKITDVSGRGVGLDVVKTKVEELSGSIECKSVKGEGTSFTIRLPLTLAIIQALMVDLGEEKYAIPLGNIETIEDISVDEIKYVQTKEVINLRGTVIPLVRLDTILDVPNSGTDESNITVVIVKKGDKLAGLVVDNLIGQQEIVIKSIGNYINASKAIGGATILGNGDIALILEVNSLF
ncbi:MAG: chemotaxis protein CheA [Lachnospiraceae bacterium]|jgi:two-component system chemotaxis sensor kinase CheA|nr:chemotaxis protein CheA [Lachnospiraceae bacterium]